MGEPTFNFDGLDDGAVTGSVLEGGAKGPNIGKEYLLDGEGDQEDFKAWRKWVEAKIAMNPRAPRSTIGPMIYSLLRGEARKAFDEIPISSLRNDDGEQLVWDTLEDAFPAEDETDKKMDAFDSILDTEPQRGEKATLKYTGKMRNAFKKGTKYNINLDDDLRSMILMRGMNITKAQRSHVLGLTSGHGAGISEEEAGEGEGEARGSRPRDLCCIPLSGRPAGTG